MSQEIINVGELPNDGSGDPLRTAFDKINNNFSNIFSTMGSSLSTVEPVELTLDPVTSQNILNIGQVIINSTQIVNTPAPVITLTPPANLFSTSTPTRVQSYSTLTTAVPVGAQEWINIGAQPNDGTGDPLRTAFDKINNNFSNLFWTTTSTSSTYTEGLTPDQVIFEYPANQFTQGIFQIRSSDPGTPDSQNITITAQITNNNEAVKYTGHGITFAGNAVSRYGMDVVSGNIRILSTPLLDAYVLHFIASEITFIGNAEPGIDIGLDGYLDSVMGTEGNIIITTEGS
jgi:hypothetical protein